MRGILHRFNENDYLREFLNVEGQQYNCHHPPKIRKHLTKGKEKKANVSRQNISASIPETIWEGEESEDSFDQKSKKRKMLFKSSVVDVASPYQLTILTL